MSSEPVRWIPGSVPPPPQESTITEEQFNQRMGEVLDQFTKASAAIARLSVRVKELETRLTRRGNYPSPSKLPDPQSWYDFVMAEYNVRESDGQEHHAFRARAIASYGLKYIFGMSSPKSGDMQSVNHSTIMYRIQAVRERPGFMEEYNMLSEAFTSDGGKSS